MPVAASLRRGVVALPFLLLLLGTTCSLVPSGGKANLHPTLTLEDEPGGVVAFQSGQPVPTFDRQLRDQVDLDGAWRFEAASVNTSLSLTDRKDSMQALTGELGSRLGAFYDDSSWAAANVPGTFDMPPHRGTTGGYFRRQFFVPTSFSEKYAVLKFGAVRYIADVWLNGQYLGYHEGGDTPFALDATQAVVPGGINNLVLRVDNPEWGTRDDIVPWGLADWWNYGGIVGDVWMEAVPALSVVRADVTPHLDGADVSIVVQHRGDRTVKGTLDVRLWPAQVNATNLLDPDAHSLIPGDAVPLFEHQLDLGSVGGDSVFRVAAPFSIRAADLWSPALPALYVLQVTVIAEQAPVDDFYTSFGLRQVRVDSTAPRILLNGAPAAFNGVAMHEEMQLPAKNGAPAGGPLSSPADIAAMLRRALALHADLIRVDHHPPNQMLTLLTDRLGLAVWEEIPLYHFTPQTFSIATDRGIPQQMLAEMDLRDFNRPSVLFHGLANESAGLSERQSALDTLHGLDRKLDGTRLVGQAASGNEPADPTSANLDVVGYTLYWGVLYGGRLSGAAVQSALATAHATYPKKPIMILEYGHWADSRGEESQQLRVFNTYYAQLSQDFGTQPQGFVGAAIWWTLDDYWTQRQGIDVEHFGLYRPDGSLRKAGATASQEWARTSPTTPPSNVRSAGVAAPIVPSERHGLLLPYLAYGFAAPAALIVALIVILSRVRRRPAW
jgi:beta-galactosidase